MVETDAINYGHLEGFPGGGDGTPLQYSCLENPMDRGAWWAAIHGVAKSRTRLNDFTFTFHFMHWKRKWQPIPVFLSGESQGRGSLVGCRLWGRRVGHDWSDLAAVAEGFPGGSDGKESACSVRDLGLTPELEKFSGEGNGYPFQYSCLENSMNRGAWRATFMGFQKVRHDQAS